MKLVLIAAVILLAGNVALAEREDPLEIFAQLKRSTKLFSGALDLLASGQRELLLTEESYVQSALDDESNLLDQLTGSDVQRNGPLCVEFIRTNVNLLMSLTGIAYTNCLNQVDDTLFNQLSGPTQLSRDQYDRLNLLAVFRGENVFVDPAKIRQKLANWQQSRTAQPELTPEATTILTAATFDELKSAFRTCMATAQSRLADNLNFTAKQVWAICAKQV